MEDQENKESNLVKMQKLRHAVDRLRNIRSSGGPPVQKQSWFARLKLRLGLGSGQKEKIDPA
jgi:hypothetical protein